MESQGVGIHILKSAGTASELGCPICGILWSVMPSALAHTDTLVRWYLPYNFWTCKEDYRWIKSQKFRQQVSWLFGPVSQLRFDAVESLHIAPASGAAGSDAGTRTASFMTYNLQSRERNSGSDYSICRGRYCSGEFVTCTLDIDLIKVLCPTMYLCVTASLLLYTCCRV